MSGDRDLSENDKIFITLHLTYSSAQIDRLFCNLEHTNLNTCFQALREIENLDEDVLSKHYITIIKRLLSAFKKFPSNSSFATRIGACIDKYLIIRANTNSDKLLKTYLNILGLKLADVSIYSIDSYLKIIEGTILKAQAVYENISASTDKPFLDCNWETIRILLKVLSDDCAVIYHQRQDQDLLIPVLTTLPIGWFYNPIDNENEDEDHEACLNEAVIILNYLHIISQSNVKTLEWYLVPQFSLTASIAALLLYSKEEIAEGCVLSLLDSIISQIAKSKYAENHCVKAYLGLKFERLLKHFEFIQTLISRDKEKLAQIISNSSEKLYSDYRNRNPAQWAEYLGTTEIKKYLMNISEKFENFQSYSIKRRRLDASKTDKGGAILNSQ
ncbi:hypothetical protein ACTXT7_016800, partial [Hymenolepis weldensis]